MVRCGFRDGPDLDQTLGGVREGDGLVHQGHHGDGLNVYADIEPISKIHNMLRATPCLWRGHLGPRVDPGPMFQQRIQESIETLQAFGYGITEPDDRNIAIRDVKTNSWL